MILLKKGKAHNRIKGTIIAVAVERADCGYKHRKRGGK